MHDFAKLVDFEADLMSRPIEDAAGNGGALFSTQSATN
jgi:hypothetical protein